MKWFDLAAVRAHRKQFRSSTFMIPFFILHYGMFCLVHGHFLFLLLGGDRNDGIMSGLGALSG